MTDQKTPVLPPSGSVETRTGVSRSHHPNPDGGRVYEVEVPTNAEASR
jgi:hypothetical protein